MPAFVGWENAEKTIIRHELVGKWTLEEYMISAKETQTLTGSVGHTVHVIVDFTAAISYPDHLLDAAPSLNHNLPANQGLVLLIRCPASIRPLLASAKLYYPRVAQNAQHVDSLDAALGIIRQHEDTSRHASSS